MCIQGLLAKYSVVRAEFLMSDSIFPNGKCFPNLLINSKILGNGIFQSFMLVNSQSYFQQ